MPEYTPLGLAKLLPGESPYEYGFTNRNPDDIDRLLQLLMAHRHDGVAGDLVTAPAAPALTELSTAGGLKCGTTYYYRVSTVDAGGLESPASASDWLTISGAIPTPDPPTATAITSGGVLPAGVYQYAVTAWVDTWTQDTISGGPVTIALAVVDGNDQKVELTLPALPSGAGGLNIYRRFPGSMNFKWQDTIVGTPAGPWVDNTLADPGTDRNLPTTDQSAYRKTIEIARPSGTTAWKVYRSLDDGDWTASLLASISTATYTDVGNPTSFEAPPSDAIPYSNPGLILPSEINGIPQVVPFRAGGVVATGVMAEWVCPYENVSLAGMLLAIDRATTPVTQPIIVNLDKWTGSWTTVLTAQIGTTASTESVDASTATLTAIAAGDRFRINVSQIGDGTATGLAVHLRMWAQVGGGAGWTPV